MNAQPPGDGRGMVSNHGVGTRHRGPLPDRLNDREMFRFGSAATQTAYTRPRFMPLAYTGGDPTITVRLCWKANSSPGDYNRPVRWKLAFERYNTALNVESFGTEKVVVDTTFANTDGGIPRPNRPHYTDIVFTQAEADSIQPGEMFRVRITRESFADDLGIDAQLLGVLIFES